MHLKINEITPEIFLAEYWQKKPLVIRQGFADFKDLLTPEEMAGLACDEMVESRRVSNKGQWDAEFGPFTEYDHLGDKDWTLIVQALNNWLPQAEELIQCFDFIPRWRLDDLMVSYGMPGGGVGPHIDLYDVFICQGSGRRRWRVGEKGDHNVEFVAHPALLHVEPFEPIIDVELLPGDILYLPSGYPHDGVTLKASMSFSVGYRTASSKEMYSALADHIIDHDMGEQRIDDPDRPICHQKGLIDNQDFSRIKQQLLDTLDDELISEFAGSFLTQSKCELDLPEEELGFQSADILAQIKQQPLVRLGGLRCLYFENTLDKGVCYINADKITFSEDLTTVIPLLCNQLQLDHETLVPFLDNSELLDQLTQWVNKGYWYFEEV